MALGTSIGGGRIMRTVGDGVTKLTPVITLLPKQVLPLQLRS